MIKVRGALITMIKAVVQSKFNKIRKSNRLITTVKHILKILLTFSYIGDINYSF